MRRDIWDRHNCGFLPFVRLPFSPFYSHARRDVKMRNYRALIESVTDFVFPACACLRGCYPMSYTAYGLICNVLCTSLSYECTSFSAPLRGSLYSPNIFFANAPISSPPPFLAYLASKTVSRMYQISRFCKRLSYRMNRSTSNWQACMRKPWQLTYLYEINDHLSRY